jgi:hypothetical protein
MESVVARKIRFMAQGIQIKMNTQEFWIGYYTKEKEVAHGKIPQHIKIVSTWKEWYQLDIDQHTQKLEQLKNILSYLREQQTKIFKRSE